MCKNVQNCHHPGAIAGAFSPSDFPDILAVSPFPRRKVEHAQNGKSRFLKTHRRRATGSQPPSKPVGILTFWTSSEHLFTPFSHLGTLIGTVDQGRLPPGLRRVSHIPAHSCTFWDYRRTTLLFTVIPSYGRNIGDYKGVYDINLRFILGIERFTTVLNCSTPVTGPPNPA